MCDVRVDLKSKSGLKTMFEKKIVLSVLHLLTKRGSFDAPLRSRQGWENSICRLPA